jgi:hypothetical protein
MPTTSSTTDSKRRGRSPGRRTRDHAAAPLPAWKAWLAITVIGSLTGLLLWWGLAIVVQCNRVNDSRVDVTVQRRFVGLIPFSTETVPDVVKADVYNVWARTSGDGKQRRGSTAALELTSRQGQVVRRTRFGPSFGTEPSEMADQIQLVLNDRSRASVTGWWMPWLVNIAALLFVLVVGSILGEVVLRALGVLKPAS